MFYLTMHTTHFVYGYMASDNYHKRLNNNKYDCYMVDQVIQNDKLLLGCFFR